VTLPARTGAAAGLAGAAVTIALVTIASRVVGFGRWVVQADAVGPNALGDAYAAANTLPNVLFEVAAGGALAGAVVPLLALPLAKALREDVDRIASALLGWAMVVLVPLAALVALLARPLVGFFLPAADAGQLQVAAMFLAVFALQIPLYGLGVVLTGVLQAHHRFLWPALAPLLSSLVVVGVYLVFGATVHGAKNDPSAIASGSLALLAWGTTAGVAAMSLPLLWPVRRAGVRLRPLLTFPRGTARRARNLAAAGVGALVAQQVSVLVTLKLANAYGEAGTFPVFQFSQAVYFLPYAVLAVPLATATFPRLAERAATGDRTGFADLTSTTTRAVLLVSGAGAAALVAAAPAVEQAFATFADGDVTGMASALTWMAPGLLGFALVFHLSRALYAVEKGRAAVTATAAGWLTAAVAAAVLVPLLADGRDQEGTLTALAAAGTLGMTVAGVALAAALVRTSGRSAGAGVTRSAGVVVLAGAAGAWAGRGLARAAVLGPASDPGLAGALVAGVLAVGIAVAVVAAAAWVADRRAITALRHPGSVEVRRG
jgi:putative peptidoglycan lipid II flippase